MKPTARAIALLYLMKALLVSIMLMVVLGAAYVIFFVLYWGKQNQASYTDQMSLPALASSCQIYQAASNNSALQNKVEQSTVNKDILAKQGSSKLDALHGRTSSGFSYFVKTPVNYRSDQTWPMLVVFAPVMSAEFMERYTGLTLPITKAGFIIVYVDAISMSLKRINQLDDLLQNIQSQFCIDSKKIFATGHSNGATVSQAINFLPNLIQQIGSAGFISSGAGLNKNDLAEYACNSGTHALILHNTEDDHFLEFGASAAEWWAECNVCDSNTESLGNGCVKYLNCQQGSVQFCEQKGRHWMWPKRHQEIVDFLSDSKL